MLIVDTCLASVTAIDTGATADTSDLQESIDQLSEQLLETTQETATAGLPISALRPVYLDNGQWKIAHALVYAEAEACSGIAMTAASAGATLSVITAGDMEDASWSWTPGQRIYLSDTGSLTQSPGSIIKEVAFALTATKIIVDPGEAIEFVY